MISNSVKQLVHGKLSRWQGELIPMSRRWVEKELGDLSGEDRTIARFALVLAKASYQIDDKMVEDVLGKDRNEERLIRILAWFSFTASRFIVKQIADQSINQLQRAA